MPFKRSENRYAFNEGLLYLYFVVTSSTTMIRKSRCMHSTMIVLRCVTKSREPFSLTRLCNVACYYTDSPFAPGDFTGSTRSCRRTYFPALTKDTSGSLSTYQSSFIDILVFILHDTPTESDFKSLSPAKIM